MGRTGSRTTHVQSVCWDRPRARAGCRVKGSERMHMVQYKTFDLGPFALQKGTVLPAAKIVYATVGRLNDAKDNAVLIPTWGSGSPEDVVGLLIGTARALNP